MTSTRPDRSHAGCPRGTPHRWPAMLYIARRGVHALATKGGGPDVDQRKGSRAEDVQLHALSSWTPPHAPVYACKCKCIPCSRPPA